MGNDVWLSLCLAKLDAERTVDQDSLSLILLHDELNELSRKISLPSVDKILEAICAERIEVLDVKVAEDEFFHSRMKKILFCLQRNKKGDLDADLGITKRHFLDEEVAKKWRDQMIKEFHPDKGYDASDEDRKNISEMINKTYKRLLGKA